MRYLGIILVFASVSWAQPKSLPLTKLAALKKQPCTFLHVWATWCTICIQEMPELFRVLHAMKKANKKINPIVIDTSSPFVQENFSRKWILTLKPEFPVYVKPGGKDQEYSAAIDKEWSGGLPYSALYDGGKQKRVWLGALSLPSFPAEVSSLCK